MSEAVKALNFLQAMAKQRIESTGRSNKIVTRWSWAMLESGEPPLVLLKLLLLLVLVSAIEKAMFVFL